MCAGSVSVGSGLMRATLAFVSHAANELLESGTYQAMQRELERPEAVLAYRAATGDAEPQDNR